MRSTVVQSAVSSGVSGRDPSWNAWFAMYASPASGLSPSSRRPVCRPSSTPRTKSRTRGPFTGSAALGEISSSCHVSATSARKVYSTARAISTQPGSTGASSAARRSGVVASATVSPTASRASQRYRSPVTGMNVAGRRESHTWETPGQIGNGVGDRTSSTSHRSGRAS